MNEERISLYQLLSDYVTSNEFEDDDRIYKLKLFIRKALSPLQQEILLEYINNGSYRKTAKRMNCSSTKIMYMVKDIKKIIIENYEK